MRISEDGAAGAGPADMQRSAGGLAYVRHGAGAPVFVMHGGPGLDHTYLRPWLDPLGAAAELVYYDHRGNGRSAEPDDWSQVDIGSWADDAEALRAELGHDRVVLLGHSFGGNIALEFALRYPERVRGLILCGASSSFQHGELAMANAAARGTPEQLEALAAGMGAPIRDDAAMERLWKAIVPLYFKRYDAEREAKLFGSTRFSGRACTRGLQECLPGFDVTARLGEIRAPTLILTGADDYIMPPEPCARTLAAIPGSRAVIFEDSGHLPFVEEPDRFVDVVRSWLAGL